MSDPLLREYSAQLDDGFRRKNTRAHSPVYVRGQLSNLERKSVEPIALEAGAAPRTLQEFLTQLPFLELRMDQHAAFLADGTEDSLPPASQMQARRLVGFLRTPRHEGAT